jgi:hypothetical protein
MVLSRYWYDFGTADDNCTCVKSGMITNVRNGNRFEGLGLLMAVLIEL